MFETKRKSIVLVVLRVKQIGPDIWMKDGPSVIAAAGFHYPTRMVVIRLKDGLFVWSPIALSDDLRQEVDALGNVAFIVSPSHLHNLAMEDWANAYPEAAVFATEGLAKKLPDLAYLLFPDQPPWGGEIDGVLFRNRIADEMVFFHEKSGTVLFCDLLQQFPQRWFKGWRAVVAKLDGMSGAEPQVPLKFRLATPKAPAREAAKVLFGWQARQVVMAHGTPVTLDASAYLRRAFRWLKANKL